MLSDTLYEAIDMIEHYQREMPDVYDSNKHHIEYVKREMVRLKRSYDAMPGTEHVFMRAVDDTEPTTEKMAREQADRHAAVIEALYKIAPEQRAKLTPERVDELTPEQVAKLTPEQVAELVAGKVKS